MLAACLDSRVDDVFLGMVGLQDHGACAVEDVVSAAVHMPSTTTAHEPQRVERTTTLRQHNTCGGTTLMKAAAGQSREKLSSEASKSPDDLIEGAIGLQVGAVQLEGCQAAHPQGPSDARAWPCCWHRAPWRAPAHQQKYLMSRTCGASCDENDSVRWRLLDKS